MKRKIVILANSRMHRARCIAGKDIANCEWIRLKNINGGHCNEGFQMFDLRRLIGNPKGPEPLDILEMSFDKKCPLPYQPENMYIDWEGKWSKIDVYPKNNLSNLLDDKECERLGDKLIYMDRISETFVNSHGTSSSLFFLHLTEKNKPKISYKYYNEICKPRLEFDFKYTHYYLAITDDYSYPSIKFVDMKFPNEKKLKDVYITLGLGEPYNGFHYILVVSIIEIDKSHS
ncbi:MAG: hypothetical protein JXA98_03180 [Methanosarcinaceae archaeon]|nr:hypothetical protein [Methanosarcinaceae archaeon]